MVSLRLVLALLLAILITVIPVSFTLTLPSPSHRSNPVVPVFHGDVTDAAASPSGLTIVYSVSSTAGSQLLLSDVPKGATKGVHQRPLATVQGEVTSMGWSPDGLHVFWVSVSNESILYLADVATLTTTKALTMGSIEDASWNPAGDQILFSGGGDGQQSLYLLNASKGSLVRLTSGGVDLYPSWAPDGRSVLFSRLEGNGSSIWRLVSAGNMTELTLLFGMNTRPVESCNGTIAFLSNRTGEWDVWTMLSDGSNAIDVVRSNFAREDGISADTTFVWSSDGSKLALSSSPASLGIRVYVIDPSKKSIQLDPYDQTHDIDMQAYSGMYTYHFSVVDDLGPLIGNSAHAVTWLRGSAGLVIIMDG